MAAETFRWNTKTYRVTELASDIANGVVKPSLEQWPSEAVKAYFDHFLDPDAPGPRPPLSVNLDYVAQLPEERLSIPVILANVGERGLVAHEAPDDTPRHVVIDGNHRITKAALGGLALLVWVLNREQTVPYEDDLLRRRSTSEINCRANDWSPRLRRADGQSCATRPKHPPVNARLGSTLGRMDLPSRLLPQPDIPTELSHAELLRSQCFCTLGRTRTASGPGNISGNCQLSDCRHWHSPLPSVQSEPQGLRHVRILSDVMGSGLLHCIQHLQPISSS